MEFKQAYVTREKPEEIFSIIEDTLSSEPNTQVFVDNKIYKWLCAKTYGRNIIVNCFFNRRGGQSFELYDKKKQERKYAYFVENTKEYMQLGIFYSTGIGATCHQNLVGFNQLLLILAKPNE